MRVPILPSVILAMLVLPSVGLAADPPKKAVRATDASASEVQAAPQVELRKQKPGRDDVTTSPNDLEAAATNSDVLVGRPDLTVEILRPGDVHQPAVARVVNVGNADTPGAFAVSVELVALCEAGKLQTPVTPRSTILNFPPLAAGEDDTKSFAPVDWVWNGNCQHRATLVVDRHGVVPESNESNNTAQDTFCASGSCY